MKGIILAGGAGSRLYPTTKVISKQLLPIYDKPMIYYPLSILLMAEIKEILIISTRKDIPQYQALLGDGTKLGITIKYEIQEHPNGLAEAFIIGEEFIGSDDVCLILGDNVFFGNNLTSILSRAKQELDGAVVFGYSVKDPTQFGVVEFNEEGEAISLEEKPSNPKSSYAVPGLYFYNNKVIEIAKQIKPSMRGELEITSVNEEYLRMGKLKVIKMGRGMAWLDTGSPQGLLKAAEFIETIQSRQKFYISCIEEIVWRNDFITTEQLKKIGEEIKMTEYGQYLLDLCVVGK